MSKNKTDQLRSEYKKKDLGEGIRGKYLKSYKEGTNLVLLSPDVAWIISTEYEVNEALQSLIHLSQKSAAIKKPSVRGIKKMQNRWLDHVYIKSTGASK